jgi:hypothetical protein
LFHLLYESSNTDKHPRDTLQVSRPTQYQYFIKATKKPYRKLPKSPKAKANQENTHFTCSMTPLVSGAKIAWEKPKYGAYGTKIQPQ